MLPLPSGAAFAAAAFRQAFRQPSSGISVQSHRKNLSNTASSSAVSAQSHRKSPSNTASSSQH
jgi:hypothetical protein